MPVGIDGHIVRPQLVIACSGDGDTDESYDGLAEWHEIFLSPPKAQLDEEVAALNAKVAALRAEIISIHWERNALSEDIEARRGRIKQHSALALLDDFITGKITHYVSCAMSYNREARHTIAIESFKEATCGSSSPYRSKDELKLLTLFGSSKGDLTWRLSQYSDGSGSYTEVIPCASLEHATSVARGLFDAEVAKWRANVEGCWGPASIIYTAQKLGLPVPSEAAEQKRAADIVAARKKTEKAQEAFNEAIAKQLALENGGPADCSEVFAPAK